MKHHAMAVLAIALVLAAAPGCKCAGHAEVPAGPRTTAEIRKSGNHLVGQASPYLEKHAHNPVDWYPWGQEAFDRARSEGKPIFLSIGYATCHWCHVMEQESFEDDETAKVLNERFIAIKVDRETRPDVDALFLDAVSALGGSTGWPLNVFLTPELEPYFGGTYFPKVARGGQPSFLSVLAETSRLHREEGPAVARRGKELLAALAAATPKAAGELTELSLTRAFDRLDGSRDAEQGGFGMRQKFPNAPTLLAELRFATRSGDQKARAHVVLTLDRMRRGGVRDQLDGTFHRYAVDRRWQVPHFEKTLYDNAQLASLYLEAGMALGDPELGAVGRAVLDGLARWQRDDGGLVVGFDADDAGGEGAFYTFTPAEIRAAIGEKEAPLVAAALSVTQAGSPELHGRSVLSRRPDAEVAKSFGVGEAVVQAAIARALPLLLTDRAGRPAPPVDDKELSGWNGLALEAYADAARWLDEPRYLEVARRIGTFLVERCRSGPSLARGMRRGAPLGPATLEDYALAARGLLALHAADGDARWLLAARAFAAAIEKRFLDPESGAFLRIEKAAEDAPLPLARPDASDGPSPSGNSAAALLFLELGAMTGQQATLDVGTRALARLVPAAIGAPLHHGAALVALDHATSPVREVVIAGDPADPRTTALVRELARTTRARVLPIRVSSDGASGELLRAYPALDEKRAQKSAPTAYVCHRGSCQRPTGDPEVLRAQLAK